MNSQMSLTLFIGDIIVGVVVLVIGLIIAWGVLNNSLDACKFAAGIGADINSLVQAGFATPGDITFYYEGPPFCRVSSSGVLLKCNPKKGGEWNPNITTISIRPYYESGQFGYDENVPVAQDIQVGVSWIGRGGEFKQKTVDIYGLYTLSLYNVYTVSSLSSRNVLSIRKSSTIFGDYLGANVFEDPLGGPDGIANLIYQLYSKCKGDSGAQSVKQEYILPQSYQIIWNNTDMCIAHLILNSRIVYVNDMYHQCKIGMLNKRDDKVFSSSVGPFWLTNTKDNDALNFHNKYFLFRHGDTKFTLTKAEYDNGAYYYYSYNPDCSKSTGTGVNDNSAMVTNFYNQSNVHKYHTGWVILRCINLDKVGKDYKINNFGYDISQSDSQKKYDTNDGNSPKKYHFHLIDYTGYYDTHTWVFDVSFDCSNNHTKIKLVDIS